MIGEGNVADTNKKPTLSQQYSLVAQAIELLNSLGFSVIFDKMTILRQERVALCLLGAANLVPGNSWADASIGLADTTWKPKTRDFISFWNANYGMKLSLGSYDDVLRKGLVHLLMAGIVTSSHTGSSIHDGTRGYYIPADAADLIQKYGSRKWKAVAESFMAAHGTLAVKLAKKKGLRKTVNVQTGDFNPIYSDGVHGELMRAVIEQFLPLHVPEYTVLFFEDNICKYTPAKLLAQYSLQDLGERQAPDVLVLDTRRQLLFIIECAHTANPISATRHYELTAMTQACAKQFRRVFVTVLHDRKALKKFITEISWETEVWLASDPEHVIHFDGESAITSYDKASS